MRLPDFCPKTHKIIDANVSFGVLCVCSKIGEGVVSGGGMCRRCGWRCGEGLLEKGKRSAEWSSDIGRGGGAFLTW